LGENYIGGSLNYVVRLCLNAANVFMPQAKIRQNLAACFENLGFKKNGEVSHRIKITKLEKTNYGYHLLLYLYPGIHIGNLVEKLRAIEHAAGGECDIYKDDRGNVHLKVYTTKIPKIIKYTDRYGGYTKKYDCAVPIGVSRRGVEVLDLADDINYHMLIAGMPGSGKSILIRVMVMSLVTNFTPQQVKLYLLDLKKNVGMEAFRGYPHVALCEGDLSKAGTVLDRIKAELGKRGELIKRAGAMNIKGYNEGSNKKIPHAVVIIDEFASLEERHKETIEELARTGRYAGVHLILCTQRPEVKIVSGQTKAMIPVRICFKVQNSHDSQTILDMDGAQYLPSIPGRCYVLRNGKTREVQGFYISDKQFTKMVKQSLPTRLPKQEAKDWVP
jgi:hypothetical protein